jgi:dipeptidyl aminopeptidase/acylaminoacyl peptidase
MFLSASSVFKYDDIFKYNSISELKFSENGKFLIFTKKSADKQKDHWITQIYFASLDFKKVVQLTRKGDNLSPEISPDSKKIAFISTRSKKREIYIINLPGGDSLKISDYPEGIRAFKWLDNETIVFTAREKKSFIERERGKNKDDAIVVEDSKEFQPVRLFLLNTKTKKHKRISYNRTQIGEFAISPDKKFIITTEIDSPKYMADAKYYKKYFLYSIKKGKIKQLFKDNKYFQPYSFNWIKRDVILMKENESDYESKRGPGYPLLYTYFIKNDRLKKINLGWDWGLGGFYSKSVYYRNNKIFTFLANGVWNYPIILSVDEKFNVKKRIIIKKGIYKNIDYFTLSPDGRRMFFIASAMDIPHRIYSVEIKKNGKFRNLKELYIVNEWIKDKLFGKREIINWNVNNERKIEGILVFPVNYDKNKKYPLIMTFHGGPYAYTKDGFNVSWGYYPQALSGDGFFVLFVNYSGSSNYGKEFGESIVGRYCEREITDIMEGLSYVSKKYNIDKDNVGVMGWSNGAILTIDLILKRDFSFAIPGAGDVNWISDWGNCAFGVQFDNLYFGKPYYEDLNLYIRKSPLFKLKKVNTPVLIFFGDKDTNVPTEQGWEFYRTMEQYGKEVKFVLMPGEPHVFGRLSHQIRKVHEEVEWIHNHVAGKKKVKFVLMKKESKISALEKYLKLKKDKNGYIGERVNGVLLPEFVNVSGIKVAKTELTVAQFNDFLKIKYNKKIVQKKHNFPIYAVSSDLLKEYFDFIFKKTGKRVRLISQNEFEKISKAESSNLENRISYWIGYTPTPEERMTWIKYLKEKKLMEKMILPVASFLPTKSGIYDFNGNLPELMSNGKILGGWFLSVKDEKNMSCPKKWVGYRLVIDNR